MSIYSVARICVRAPIEEVFASCTTPSEIAACFNGYGPIAGIERIDVDPNLPFEPGLVRTIVNSDGTTIREEMRIVNAPIEQAYELSEFTGPFQYVVKSAGGHWTFVKSNDEVDVTWTFRFEPKGIAGRCIVLMLRPFFYRAQMRCLKTMATRLQR